MELFGILAIVLSTVISAATAAITNTQNRRNAEEQLQNQQNFAHNEAELANQRALENYYNTQAPAAKLQQIKEAGLSPGLMYGGMYSGGGVTTTSQASTPSANLPIMQNPLSNIGEIFENIKKLSETENISTGTEKTKEEINKIKSDIELNNETITKIATENNLTEVLTANAKIDGTLKQIESEIAANTKQSRIEIVNTQLKNMQNEGKKLLEEIKGLNIDNENKQRMYDATVNKIAAETCLIYKQVIKTEAETMLTKATTALTTEQTNLTFVQRQETYKKIEQYKDINAKIEAEIKLIDQQTEKTKLEKVTEITKWIETGTKIADGISKMVLRAAIAPK